MALRSVSVTSRFMVSPNSYGLRRAAGLDAGRRDPACRGGRTTTGRARPAVRAAPDSRGSRRAFSVSSNFTGAPAARPFALAVGVLDRARAVLRAQVALVHQALDDLVAGTRSSVSSFENSFCRSSSREQVARHQGVEDRVLRAPAALSSFRSSAGPRRNRSAAGTRTGRPRAPRGRGPPRASPMLAVKVKRTASPAAAPLVHLPFFRRRSRSRRSRSGPPSRRALHRDEPAVVRAADLLLREEALEDELARGRGTRRGVASVGRQRPACASRPGTRDSWRAGPPALRSSRSRSSPPCSKKSISARRFGRPNSRARRPRYRLADEIARHRGPQPSRPRTRARSCR